MKNIFLLALLCGINITQTVAQGCVAIRGAGGASCSITGHLMHAETTGYTFNLNTRYFKSYKHYVGTAEQKQRVALGTEVINHTFIMDAGLTKTINSKWSAAIFIPIIANDRSSLYEHANRGRFTTSSFGIGDIRIAAYKWLKDPVLMPQFNVQVGLGIKLPTGEYRYTDRFTTATGTAIGPVDQSIQLGDGGTGFTVELNAFHRLGKKLNAYGNFYYLINPREQNGVSTARGGISSAASVLYTSDVMSVPDQYLIRGGLNYQVRNWTFSGGLRFECIPAKDLIGGNEGFRRPGEILTVEPGINYMFSRFNLFLAVPTAIMRNRTQSYPDQIRSNLTGTYHKGDAAFADYAINVGFNIKL
jgi:hypothetical protein